MTLLYTYQKIMQHCKSTILQKINTYLNFKKLLFGKCSSIRRRATLLLGTNSLETYTYKNTEYSVNHSFIIMTKWKPIVSGKKRKSGLFNKILYTKENKLHLPTWTNLKSVE